MSKIISRPYSKEGQDNYDRIFKKNIVYCEKCGSEMRFGVVFDLSIQNTPVKNDRGQIVSGGEPGRLMPHHVCDNCGHMVKIPSHGILDPIFGFKKKIRDNDL